MESCLNNGRKIEINELLSCLNHYKLFIDLKNEFKCDLGIKIGMIGIDIDFFQSH